MDTYSIICKLKRYFKILFWCKLLKWHDYTSAFEKGIKPTHEQLNTGLLGFYQYAKMYCDRCGYIYKPSQELICKYKNLDSKLEK